MDKSSPLLFFEAVAGQSLGTTTLEISQTGGAGKTQETYYKLELHEAIVSSYSTSATGDERPSESFSLNFTKIKFSYTSFDNEGKAAGTTTKGWDVAENEAF